MVHARPLKLMAALLAAPALLVLMLSLPAAAKTITYNPQTIYFTYCYSHPPAQRRASGATVLPKARECTSRWSRPPLKKIAEGNLDLPRVNPQTGPCYLEAAGAGCTCKAHLATGRPR